MKLRRLRHLIVERIAVVVQMFRILRPAPKLTTEIDVLDAAFLERSLDLVLVEVRRPARVRHRADVRHDLDIVLTQQIHELFECVI